jgi:hypothetical protein
MEVGQKIKAVGKEKTLYIMSDGWVYTSLQKYATLIIKVSYINLLQAPPQYIPFSIEIVTLRTFFLVFVQQFRYWTKQSRNDTNVFRSQYRCNSDNPGL